MNEHDKVAHVKDKFIGEKDVNASDIMVANRDREQRRRRERRRKISIAVSLVGLSLLIGWVFVNTYFLESPYAHFYFSDEIEITNHDFSEETLQTNEFMTFREILESENRFLNTNDDRMENFPKIVSLMNRTDEFYTAGEPLVLVENGTFTMAQSFRTRVFGGIMVVEVMYFNYVVNPDETLTLSRPSWFSFEYDSRINRIEFIQQPRDRARLALYNVGVEFTAVDSRINSASYSANITRAVRTEEVNGRFLQQGVTIFNSIPTNIVAQGPVFDEENTSSFGGFGQHSYNWTVGGFEVNYTDLMYSLIENITFGVIMEDEGAPIVARVFINRQR